MRHLPLLFLLLFLPCLTLMPARQGGGVVSTPEDSLVRDSLPAADSLPDETMRSDSLLPPELPEEERATKLDSIVSKDEATMSDSEVESYEDSIPDSAADSVASRAGETGGTKKVYLLHADTLRANEAKYPGAQLLNGNVQFLHEGMYMWCDSAVLYEQDNNFEAYGHVRMEQGDTLSLTGNRLFYHGESQIAEVREEVVMTHRETVLLTDSLNYDRLLSFGYYFEGGKLLDETSVLESDWGEYHTDTKESKFLYSVVLTNPTYLLYTDTLYYDVETKWSHTVGPSRVYNGTNEIHTTNGFFNTATEGARLYDRSVLINPERSIVADSMRMDRETGYMEAFRNVAYDDFANKNIMTGHYGRYNELTGYALVTDSAVVKDYSEPDDTLFTHGDTLRLYTYNLNTDSVYRVMHAYFHVRAYRSDIQAVCDSMVYNTGIGQMKFYCDPIIWSDEKQIIGEEMTLFRDTTIDSIWVERQALLLERLDSVHFNQVAGQIMRAYFQEGQLRENHVDGNVIVVQFPLEKDSTILYQNYVETSLLKMYLTEERKLDKIWTPAATGTFYAAGTAPREHTYLENFSWFDYIRPLGPDDLFEWRPKAAGTELKNSIRRQPPVQTLPKVQQPATPDETTPAKEAATEPEATEIEATPKGDD